MLAPLLVSHVAFESPSPAYLTRACTRRSQPTCSLRSVELLRSAAAGSALTGAGLALALGAANACFGILDQTADELADILGVDEVPPALVRSVLSARPLYEPIKGVSSSCTNAVFPEFNVVNDFNDCLLLKRRLFWRGGGKGALLIDQTMEMGTMWQTSTGSSVWGGGVVLARHMEGLGEAYWKGKQVIELGSGAGLGAITAAKLGASNVLATDRDASVLQLTASNAAGNLGARAGVVGTAVLEWGQPNSEVDSTRWDLVIGADLTYNRDAWPFLFQQIKRLRAPALLSASERRPNELASLSTALEENGLRYRILPSPFASGYAATNIKIFQIEPFSGQPGEASATSPELPAASSQAVTPTKEAARAARVANEEAIAKIAGSAIRKKCSLDDAIAGACQP